MVELRKEWKRAQLDLERSLGIAKAEKPLAKGATAPACCWRAVCSHAGLVLVGPPAIAATGR
jgi:hypothetical protein